MCCPTADTIFRASLKTLKCPQPGLRDSNWPAIWLWRRRKALEISVKAGWTSPLHQSSKGMLGFPIFYTTLISPDFQYSIHESECLHAASFISSTSQIFSKIFSELSVQCLNQIFRIWVWIVPGILGSLKKTMFLWYWTYLVSPNCILIDDPDLVLSRNIGGKVRPRRSVANFSAPPVKKDWDCNSLLRSSLLLYVGNEGKF